ncbi:unnamed protein product [Spirodela intermedia]|uniref:Uncharacterized protein n=1 Tax=Spirodela intermedia TaxID=51605 RepID=A0A7I8ICZ2_SPIIN|nr:unnamed protein product [Spirodela intermedia]CAA6654912.1 unnamed protein product [Spirodela intermedia]
MSLMKLFMIPIALLEMPMSGWTCFNTLKMYIFQRSLQMISIWEGGDKGQFLEPERASDKSQW